MINHFYSLQKINFRVYDINDIVIYVMILTLPVPNIFVVNETSFFPFENLRAFYRKSNYFRGKGGVK